MTRSEWFTARKIASFPAREAGKWHAAWVATDRPVCGVRVYLTTTYPPIRTVLGQPSGTVHHLLCRRCLELSTQPGRTGEGIAE